MAGARRLSEYADIIGNVFSEEDMRLTLGIQSNGLLFDRGIGDLLLRRGMTIGVSIDGPPEVNDRNRVDKLGRATSGELERRLRLLTSKEYRRAFTGFLCVIDPNTEPERTVDYLLSFDPPSIDFLFPLDNHDRLPPGKRAGSSVAPYGEWLVRAFDRWLASGRSTEVRIFHSLIGLIAGAPSTVETLGVDPVDLIVIETNGDIEAVDSLKAVFNGATHLGYNVVRNQFDEVATNVGVRSRQMGVNSLSEQCKACNIVEICGGGYLPHRYSKERLFDNPSVYCADLKLLIEHIANVISMNVGRSKCA